MGEAAAAAAGPVKAAREVVEAVAADCCSPSWEEPAAMAVTAARDVDAIRCFSPNKARRESFCRALAPELGADVVPVETAAAAVDGADIVLCATNSLDPVFETGWLAAGMHLGTIRDGELPPDAIRACDRVAIHDPRSVSTKHYETTRGLDVPDLHKQAADSQSLDFLSGVPTIFDLAAGKAKGRASETETTCFLNLRGLAVQFTAVGAVLYRKAREAGRGQELPTEWFTEDVHP